MATDAARDAVEIEREHGRGLEVLDEILSWIGRSRALAVDVENGDIDAGGASALLLAVPLVVLAGERAPATVVVRQLAHSGALQPALLRSAHADGLSFVLSSVDGRDVLRVHPVGCARGEAWGTSWVTPLDVRLYARRARSCAYAGALRHPAHDQCAGAPGLVVDCNSWRRLSERAGRYLV